MQLLSTPTSPYGRVVLGAIYSFGLMDRIEFVPVAARTPQNLTLDYNPTGKVPTLLLADPPVALSESRLICEYLCELSGHQGFFADPNDLTDRAFEGIATGFIDGVSVLVRELRRPVDDQSADILRQERERADRCVAFAATRVAERGTQIDFANLMLVIGLDRLVDIHPQWRSDAPALADWFDTMSATPTIAATRVS